MPRIDQLWYELDARTDKLDKGLQDAQKGADRFTNFFKRAPIAVMGAFAAAMAAVGVAATKMAADLDVAIRRAGSRLRLTGDEVARMRDGVLDLAKETPRSVFELGDALDWIAEHGVTNATEALERLRLGLLLSDATGGDLKQTTSSLDALLDAFGITADRTAETVAQLYAAAEGRVPLNDLSRALERSAATLAAFNVDAVEAARAMATLLDAGIPARVAATNFAETLAVVARATTQQKEAAAALGIDLSSTALKSKGLADFMRDLAEKTQGSADALVRMGFSTQQLGIITTLGKTSYERFKNEVISTEEAMRRLEVAANTNRESAQALWGIIKNNLSVAMVDLGNKVLPLVERKLLDLLTVLQNFDGTIARFYNRSAIATVSVLGRMGEKLQQTTNGVNDLKDAWQSVLRGFNTGALNLEELTKEQLQQFLVGLRGAQATLADLGREDLAGAPGIENLVRRVRELLAAATAVKEVADDDETPPPDPVDPALLAKRTALMQRFLQEVAALTRTAVDDLEVALQAFEQEIVEAFGHIPAEAQAALDGMRARLEATRVLEPLEESLDRLAPRVAHAIEEATAGFAHESLALLPEVEEIVQRAEAVAASTKEGTAEQEKANAALARARELLRQILGIQGRVGESVGDEARTRQEIIDDLRDQARTIETTARSALQLAEAFGVISAETSRTLQNLVQIGANLPGVLSGDPTAILGALGGIAALFGGGSDPEAERRAEIVRQNTAAIEDLTRRIGDLGLIDVPGAQFAGVLRALQASFLGGGTPSSVRGAFGTVSDELERLGLTMDDLREVADALGISFAGANPTIAEMRQLLAALQEVELTQFAQTFTGQLEALRAEFDIFDISDPIEQIQRLLDVLGNADFGAPELFKLLTGGLDLTTPEGQAELDRRIRELFLQLQAGTLDPSVLGGLTAQQLLDLLQQLEGSLDQLSEEVGASGETQQFAIQRTITEVTGSRIASLLTSGNFFAERTALNTKRIVELLAGDVAVRPPPLAALDQFAGAVPLGDVTVNLTVQVSGVTGAGAEEVGQKVASVTAREIDRLLGDRMREAQRVLGTVRGN